MDIDIVLEDLDNLVELARENYSMVGYLNIVHSANYIRNMLISRYEEEL